MIRVVIDGHDEKLERLLRLFDEHFGDLKDFERLDLFKRAHILTRLAQPLLAPFENFSLTTAQIQIHRAESGQSHQSTSETPSEQIHDSNDGQGGQES